MRREALAFLDAMTAQAYAEDEHEPHVLLIVDPEAAPDYTGPVVGPYPDRATALEAAAAKRAGLNDGNNDVPFEVHVVRFFDAADE